jgi:hypothetical protein
LHADQRHNRLNTYISLPVATQYLPRTSPSIRLDVVCGRNRQDIGKGKKKRPVHVRPKAEPFAFAGVWDVWKGDGGAGVTSFSIATTKAALSISAFHSRMPVVLDDSQIDECVARRSWRWPFAFVAKVKKKAAFTVDSAP